MGNDASIFRKSHIQTQSRASTRQWSLSDATLGLKQLSVFMLTQTDDSFDVSPWKSIRHPFIVQYYDCGIFRGKRCIVTEHVEPLRPILEKLTTDEVISGLHDIASALSFLHEKCLLSHNNLHLDSLFISRHSNSSWKLGCLQLVSSAGRESGDKLKQLLEYHQHYGSTNTLPPEDLLSDSIQPITGQDIHRRDAYSFGLLLNQLLANERVDVSEELASLRLESDQRPRLSSILGDKIFAGCEYMQLKSAILDFASFDEKKKKTFIETVVAKMRALPESLVGSNVIPMLLTSRILMLHPETSDKLLPYLLIPSYADHELAEKPLIDSNLFETFVIPVICKLFYVRNAQLRLILLQYLPYYMSLIPREQLKEALLPQIMLGMNDVNEQLVSATFSAMSSLVLAFGAETVVGPRKKLFSNDKPKLKATEANFGRTVVDTKIITPIPDTSMSERSEPDGGENISSVNLVMDLNALEGDDWPDWEQTVLSEPIVKQGAGAGAGDSSIEREADLQQEPGAKVETRKEEAKGITSTFNSKHRGSNSELDIKALNIKIAPTEVDNLFSEMEPQVKFSRGVESGSSETRSEKSAKKGNATSLFEFKDHGEVPGEAGWSDDAWDQESDLEPRAETA